MILQRLAIVAGLVIALLTGPASARQIVDSAGRTIDIPDRIDRVYAAGPPAMVLLYALKPEAMVGWPRRPYPEELPFIAEPYRDLPETGRLTGRGGEANLEVVLGIAPDLILDFGSVSDTYVSLADRVQSQTGIPYVLIDGRFANTAEALRLVGDILGVAERGDALARYSEATFAKIDSVLAVTPPSDRPRTYLARGPAGLETGLKGSINTEIIERAGGINVADPGNGQRGLVETSIEQVIVADPDTIVTWDRAFYDAVWTDPLWQGIDAVANGRVYLSPTAPFGWIDRPPSINRLIGLNWLAASFFPDAFAFDLEAETRRFYKLFYHVDLTDSELATLIEWTKGRPPQQ
ncbi:iron ABC transporter substrate-binding protein [Pararhizobium haloflavum]|uniref:iron ABC transporter substrate-binding protein n=1 Tax=Pararhizobium haloflavum TaxID=2037914 RepID=UPI000C1A6082|nr:iron ABC transporter substrate-binding protein [Pararhizobium haloflavum]